jgi:hypothetical protein
MANNVDDCELESTELGQYPDGDDDDDPDPAEHKCGCNESARYRKALGRIAHILAPGTRAHRIARRALR